MIKIKKLNDVNYIFRVLRVWYVKGNENIFNYIFNHFAKHIILEYLSNSKNKNLIIKFLKNDDVYTDINLYNNIVDDVVKTFNYDDAISFETFEHIIY